MKGAAAGSRVRPFSAMIATGCASILRATGRIRRSDRSRLNCSTESCSTVRNSLADDFRANGLSGGLYNLRDALRITAARTREAPGFQLSAYLAANSSYALHAIERRDIKLLGYVGDETPWQNGAAFTMRKHGSTWKTSSGRSLGIGHKAS